MLWSTRIKHVYSLIQPTNSCEINTVSIHYCFNTFTLLVLVVALLLGLSIDSVVDLD